MQMVSWCVVVACVVGAVVAAPQEAVFEKSVSFGVAQPQPGIVTHPHNAGVEQPHPGIVTQTHHKTHTVDPHFRDSDFHKAMQRAGVELFDGLGRAGGALGDFLARLAGGGRHR